VFLDVPGEGEIQIRYDWNAIAALHGLYGKAWEGEVGRIMSELDAGGLARILALGSSRPAEWWSEKSPPFMPAARAVQDALHLSFFGAGGLDGPPPLARRLMTLLRKAGGSGSPSAGMPATSGG
jgi:hypothetical protein